MASCVCALRSYFVVTLCEPAVVYVVFVAPIRGCENKNGQRSIASLIFELHASHEQNAALLPRIF